MNGTQEIVENLQVYRELSRYHRDTSQEGDILNVSECLSMGFVPFYPQKQECNLFMEDRKLPLQEVQHGTTGDPPSKK